jgi:2-oxoglutarate dehydrogenase complex dehydrogenase (E1) component-like enzyme
VRYIGRAAAASPATGSPKSHRRQQQAIIEAAFAPIDNAEDILIE